MTIVLNYDSKTKLPRFKYKINKLITGNVNMSKKRNDAVKKFEDLPDNAKNYIQELEKFIETKVASISTSPERKDTILIENPF